MNDAKLLEVEAMLEVKDDSDKSNWNKLEDEDSQGLLLSLLRMKHDELEVLATILDAHPLN